MYLVMIIGIFGAIILVFHTDEQIILELFQFDDLTHGKLLLLGPLIGPTNEVANAQTDNRGHTQHQNGIQFAVQHRVGSVHIRTNTTSF